MWTRWFAGVLTVLGAACVSACAVPQGGAATSVPAQDAKPVLSEALDLATFSGSWGRRQTSIERAMRRESDHCMVLKGFEPQGAPGAVEGFDEAAAIDLARRSRVGYASEPLSAGPSASDPAVAAEARYVSRLTPARRDAYYSTLLGTGGPAVKVQLPGGRQILTPSTGCIAEGRRAVFGSIEKWAMVQYAPESLSDLVTPKIANSSVYRGALRAWQKCLAERGIHAQSPEALEASSTSRAPRRPQIAAAVADGECALESHLPRAAIQARKALLASSLDAEQRSLLNQATRLWLDAAGASDT
ncbi:hypothetical protein [Intrasporangium sp. YIM S08009]|uniref:hypothetical protein n=1 Tax=Intrasporangium zincisolvens TaxID=3080018 RepID=UPI002B054869|nr:hypothetical protein [Intrasporangium sp. YIM S08009]